jgi:hypothetical protein
MCQPYAAVNATCVAACDAASPSSPVTWIAVKRALRLATALVSRHAALLCGTEGAEGAAALVQLASAARRVASLPAASLPAAPPAPAVAAAFALLEALLGVSSEKGTPPAAAAAAFAALAPPPAAAGIEAAPTAKGKKDGQLLSLTALVRQCVLPHGGAVQVESS